MDTNNLSKVQLPPGTYGRIAPRSGLAAKHHIDVGAGEDFIDFDSFFQVSLMPISLETLGLYYSTMEQRRWLSTLEIGSLSSYARGFPTHASRRFLMTSQQLAVGLMGLVRAVMVKEKSLLLERKNRIVKQ